MFASRSGLPSPATDIHPAWCTCHRCSYAADRSLLRADLFSLGLGLLGGLGFVALKLTGAF